LSVRSTGPLYGRGKSDTRRVRSGIDLSSMKCGVVRTLVVTTINPPNKALRSLAEGARANDVPFVIVGDTKTPADFHLDPAVYLSVAEQTKRFPSFCRELPLKHYARKNVGYLAAIENGAREIQETDDDNIPYAEFWRHSPGMLEVDAITADSSC